MSNFRAVLTFAVCGTLLGIVLATLSASSILTGSMCGFTNDNQLMRGCIDTVQQTTSGLIRYQLYGGAAGAIVGVAAGVFFSVRRKKKDDGAAAAPPPAAAA